MSAADTGAAHGCAAAWTRRALCPEDLPRVLAIERVSFPKPWTAALFLQELTLPFSRIVVICDERRFLGYACRWLIADEMQILNVAVDPAARRCGVARALLQPFLDEARAYRVATVSLEVRPGNTAAGVLYRSLGFRVAGVRRHYYGRGEDALTMALRLRA